MKRLVLFVEGQTEEAVIAAFFKRWLDARLDDPVGIQTVRFEGWPEFERDAPKKARFYLEENPKRNEIIAVVGLLDLYGPTFYPETAASVAARYKWGKKHMEELVGQEKYHQFFAVHETEAWLLSDLAKFPTEIRRAIESRANTPETVNFNEPPAKLLSSVYRRETNRDYKKVVEARNRFPKLDPETACAKCPYLNEMLHALWEIVQTARNIP